jgi:undecaprenyl-diphosphatase
MTLQSIDTALLLSVNRGFANNLFDLLMPFLSTQGSLLVIPFLICQLVLAAVRRDDRGRAFLAAAVWTILIACAAVYLADWTETLLKNAIARIRPCKSVDGLRLIVSCPPSFSMPSGHAISSFACAFPLYYLSKGYLPRLIRIYPPVLASFISFSRIYLGVHYPSDVLAGALLGISIALALSLSYLAVPLWMEKGKGNKRGNDA